MKKQLFINKNVRLEKVNEDIHRRILAHGDSLMVVEAYFAKDAIGAKHEHYHDQVTYCISGKFEYDLEGEIFILNPGDSVFVKGHQLHGLKCLEQGTLLDIFSPTRKDFL